MKTLEAILVLASLVASTGCSSTLAKPTRVFVAEESVASFTQVHDGDGLAAGALAVGTDGHASVVSRLGAPMGKATLRTTESCTERWIYSRPTIVEGDARSRVLLVDFDASGLVCRSVYRDE